MAIAIESSIVQRASANVGSSRCPINSVTFLRKKNDSPRSPWNTRRSQMPNCTTIGRSRPRASWMRWICSVDALSPAITAAGSPGVSRISANTTTDTTRRTGMVARTRRSRKRSNGSLQLDVPGGEKVATEEVFHVAAHCRGIAQLPERDIGADLHRSDLHVLGDRLALRVRLGASIGVAQPLQLLVAGPAGHRRRLVTSAVEAVVHDGIGDVVQTGDGGVEVPAALRRSVLLRKAGYHRLPVHGLHLDLEARLAEQLGRDHRRLHQHGEIRGLQDDHRRAVVTGLLQ